MIRYALILAALVLFAPSPASAQECTNTCLDICQTEGDDLIAGCNCGFGCGCLCGSFSGGLTCADFPGCQEDLNVCPVSAAIAARDPRWGLTARGKLVIFVRRFRVWWAV